MPAFFTLGLINRASRTSRYDVYTSYLIRIATLLPVPEKDIRGCVCLEPAVSWLLTGVCGRPSGVIRHGNPATQREVKYFQGEEPSELVVAQWSKKDEG